MQKSRGLLEFRKSSDLNGLCNIDKNCPVDKLLITGGSRKLHTNSFKSLEKIRVRRNTSNSRRELKLSRDFFQMIVYISK